MNKFEILKFDFIALNPNIAAIWTCHVVKSGQQMILNMYEGFWISDYEHLTGLKNFA